MCGVAINHRVITWDVIKLCILCLFFFSRWIVLLSASYVSFFTDECKIAPWVFLNPEWIIAHLYMGLHTWLISERKTSERSKCKFKTDESIVLIPRWGFRGAMPGFNARVVDTPWSLWGVIGRRRGPGPSAVATGSEPHSYRLLQSVPCSGKVLMNGSEPPSHRLLQSVPCSGGVRTNGSEPPSYRHILSFIGSKILSEKYYAWSLWTIDFLQIQFGEIISIIMVATAILPPPFVARCDWANIKTIYCISYAARNNCFFSSGQQILPNSARETR